MPVTCGRTSATVVADVRPGSTVVSATLRGFTVITVTWGGGGAAGGAFALSQAAVIATVAITPSQKTTERCMVRC